MSHYQPSLEHYPLVFLVNWFYKLMIPATIGGMGFFVLTDIYRRVRRRRHEEESMVTTDVQEAKTGRSIPASASVRGSSTSLR
jgi:hypothetical protein